LAAFAVFKDIRHKRVRPAVAARLMEANFYIPRPAPVKPWLCQTESLLQFACGAGWELCVSTDNTRQAVTDIAQRNLAARFQTGINNAVGVFAKFTEPCYYLIGHFYCNFCHADTFRFI
jgi:hypothetical protein